ERRLILLELFEQRRWLNRVRCGRDPVCKAVVVVINTGLRFGTDSDTLPQANPDVATGLETSQVVFSIFLVIESSQLRIVLRERLRALAGEHEVFVNSRVAEASEQRTGDPRPVAEPVPAVTDFSSLQIRLERDALGICTFGERIRTARQVH